MKKTMSKYEIENLIYGNDFGSKLMRKGYESFIKEHPNHKNRIVDIWCEVSVSGMFPDYVYIQYEFCGNNYKYKYEVI